jgi:peptidoglycan glycosyltransferase
LGINSAIGRLSTAFLVFFVLLGARAVWLQAIVGPRIAADEHNPRLLLLQRYRGDILARDGTPLAHATAHGREYPYGRVLAHAVGYASARYGTSGLERAFDRELSPQAASLDPLSQLIALLSGPRTLTLARGADVITTIDLSTQEALYGALSAYPRAAGVALDPRTGEVLALASVPSFEPAAVDADFASLVRNAGSPLLDRAVDGLYPPGSTFKIFTAAAALDSGVIAADDTFEDPGYLQVGTFTVHDNEGEATGTEDLAGAFALSSNVDFAQIALRLGPERWFEYAARWGLGKPPDFTLPAQPDNLPKRSTVTPSILAQLAFGQADLLVTPLRMALLGATIAAGGNEPQPYLVRAVRDARGRRAVAAKAVLAQPISGETASAVRDLMVAVVERGTGTAAALPDVQVAGKTGTATNPAGRSHAWFVAFAPAEQPRVVVAIVVENAGYGGAVAAPIARRVLSVALARLR